METPFLSPNSPTRNPTTREGAMLTRDEDTQDFGPVMNDAVASVDNGQTRQDDSERHDTDQTHSTSLSPDAANTKNESSAQGVTLSETTVSTSGLPQQTDVKPSIEVSLGDSYPQFKEKVLGQLEESKTPSQQVNVAETGSHTTTSKAESLLLQQIHQIVDQGKEKGTIVIRGTDVPDDRINTQADHLQNLSSPLFSDNTKDVSLIQTRSPVASLAMDDESKKGNQKSVKLDGIHQNISEQFLNAKLRRANNQTKGVSENTDSGQNDSNQPNKAFLQQASTSTTTPVTELKPMESFWGQQFGQFSNSSSQSEASNVAGKFTPPPPSPVPEKELVANIIQRFNNNPRLQTSKITMQLNPAELGALKIDLLVKNDSISANIVAQSRQVLDTLEKNMPRLRAVLEEQGFSIDSFNVSMDGADNKQEEFLQQQFSPGQEEFTSGELSYIENNSFDALLHTEEETLDFDNNDTGVNLTV